MIAGGVSWATYRISGCPHCAGDLELVNPVWPTRRTASLWGCLTCGRQADDRALKKVADKRRAAVAASRPPSPRAVTLI